MFEKRARLHSIAGLLLLVLAAAIGCTGSRTGALGGRAHRHDARSLDELRASDGWIDLEAQTGIRAVLRPDELLEWAAKTRALSAPAKPFPPKQILVISGGGIYGAYPAGVLSGWSETGTRPVFDVVTGVSTGAFVGVYAFLGPAYDCELRRYYTTVQSEDIYRRRRFPWSILSESFADSAPLARLIAQTLTDERIAAIAAEHGKGRRLFVGTSDLDTRRAVIWDIGAIATRATPADRELIRKILLATGSVPGFFPPVRIPVTVDGVTHIERHVDGNTSSSVFFAPPWVSPEDWAALPANWLHGSELYLLVSGKLYADPTPVKSRTLRIASNAVSTLLYDQTRSDLHKLYLLTVLTGMNFNLASIPADLPLASGSTELNPAEMTRMFEAGAEWARTNRRWRQSPPGYEPGEGPKFRSGTVLTDLGRRALTGPADAGGIPPVIPETR